MKNEPLFFEFSVDRETKSIIVQREFAARLEPVWDAWTKPEILDQWWAADGWKSQTKTMKFEVGGHRHYLMTGPEGESIWGLTTYATIQLHDKFSGTESSADEDAAINGTLPLSTYAVVFEEKDDKTFIRHSTSFKELKDLELNLQYGFEVGTVDAYKRLDLFLT